MPVAVGQVQASSGVSLAGSSSFIDDSSSTSQNFNDVLDKATDTVAQKSADAPQADSQTAAPAAQTTKSGKKSKASKARKDDANANQVQSNTTAKKKAPAVATSTEDTTTQETDSQDELTTAVADTSSTDRAAPDAEAQLGAFVVAAQEVKPNPAANAAQAAVAVRPAPKVQKTQGAKVVSTAHVVAKDTPETDEPATHETQSAEDHPKVVPVKPQSEDDAETEEDPSKDSVQNLVDQLSPQAGQDQENATKTQAAPKTPVRQVPVFGQTIVRDAKYDGASNAAPANSSQAKATAAARTQAAQPPIDADSLVSVTEIKGRTKSAADDQSDDKDPALNAVPAAAPKVASAPVAPTDKPADARFAEVNHPEIVSNVRGQLLPNGGSMQLRLDPPDLGRLDVTVTVKDGVMSAAFATATDQATRLLSHSLGQLKTALESAGVTVEKLQVQQSPKSQGGDTSDSQQQSQNQQDPSARQEQQRKEILEKMWERISMGPDDVDVTG